MRFNEVGVAVFAYNRSEHLNKTFLALKNNTVHPSKLFLFHDGIKNGEDRREWDKVQSIIESVEWCDKEIITSSKNKGLAKSITEGIDYVLKFFEKVIVLEDDCITSRNFMSYMITCLDKYEREKSVFGVSGYSWPSVENETDSYDAYFIGRVSSWGWGTWRDRWEKFRRDDDLINRLRSDRLKSIYLETWGSDLEQMLTDRIKGNNDSWAVYWALNTIENKGVFVSPYEPLVYNIGFDGSGTNCGKSDEYLVKLSDRVITEYKLPDEVHVLEKTKICFAELYGSYTVLNDAFDKENVIVYGLGNYFRKNEKILNERYYICAVMDVAKKGFYAGKPIIKIGELSRYSDIPIIIMIENRHICIEIKRMLENTSTISNRIILGSDII